MLPATLAAAALLGGCGGDEAAPTTTAPRNDRLRDVRTPADVCRALPASRLRAAMLDPGVLPSFERAGRRLALDQRRVGVGGRVAPACVYAMRRGGTGFEFLTVIVARGGDQAALRERLKRDGGEDVVEVDVAGRASSYGLGRRDGGRITPAQLAVPAGDATLVVRPGITIGIDRMRDRFSPDRRRDGAVNIARAVLGEPFVGA